MRTPTIIHHRRPLIVATAAIALATTASVWAAASDDPAHRAASTDQSLAATDPVSATAGAAGNASISEQAITTALDRLLESSPHAETVSCIVRAVAAGSLDGSQLTPLASDGLLTLDAAQALATTLPSCVSSASLLDAAEAALGGLPKTTTDECAQLASSSSNGLDPALAAVIVVATALAPDDATAFLATAAPCQPS